MAGTDYGFKAKDRAKVSAENREAFIQQVNSQYEQKQEAARTKSDTDLLSGVNAGKVTNNQNAIRSGTTTKPTRTVGKESTTPLKSAGSKGNTAAATWENGKGPNPKAALAAQAEKANQRRKANISRLGKDSTIGRDLGYTRDRDLTAVTITPAQRLNSLANNINQSEKQLTEWGLQLNRLQAAAQNGTSGAASKYNALAEKYNATFEQYAADIEAYNKLYNGEFRDSAVRGKYAQREYMQQRQANRDLGARRSYQQRLNEEEARAPQETTLRRKGASVGEHSYKRISGEEPREAGYTFTHEPTRLQQWGRAIHNSYVGNMKAAAGAFYRNSIPEGGSVSGMNSEIGVSDQSKARLQYWSNELLSSGREQSQRGQAQQTLATQGLGAFGTFIVDSSIAGIQMMMDMGISVVTGGSMLPAMFVRSMGGGYLTAEQMGANSEAALAYGIGVGAVEALSEKMFSVFGIANRFAKGAVSQEMSERVIDRLVKNLASTPEGKAALSRMFTLLFATGSEGLEEVAAEVLEPVIRKFTLDPKLDIKSEIDWESALYQGLVGAFLGGIGGAVDLVNTKGTYWKYYLEGIDEGIQRYEEAVKKHGLESKEAMKAAKEIWTAGNKKMNQVAGTIDGRAVTYHQLAAMEEARAYGRRNAEGNQVQGPRLADSLNLNNYLEQEENARKEAENQRLEAARREEAPTIDQAQPGQGGEFPGSTNGISPSSPQGELTETSRDSASDEGIVRLDTARSAQTRAQAPEGAAESLRGIPEEEMTQEEKDELQYGSGAVEELGRYTGLARRMGSPKMENQGGTNNDRLSYGGSQRDAGERGREGSESLGGTAAGREGGQVPTGRRGDGRTAQADRGILQVANSDDQRAKIKKRQQNAANLEMTSGLAIGLRNADDRAIMAELTDEMIDADEELVQIKNRLRNRGFEVHFFRGLIGTDTGSYSLGAHQDGVIWICVDNPDWTATQISLHEEMHGRIWRNPRLFSDLVIKLGDKKYLDRLSEISTRYQQALLLISQGKTEKAFVILQEMVCDLYAGVNEFAGESENVKSLRTMVEEEVKDHEVGIGLDTRAPPEDDSDTQFYETEKEAAYNAAAFAADIEEWNQQGRPLDGTFILGNTGEVLQGLGAIESDIYINAEKINSILDRPKQEITIDLVKKIPLILDRPVLISKSRHPGPHGINTRLVVFASVKAESGAPINVILDLRPVENGLALDDMQKVDSVYAKNNRAYEAAKDSDYLYVNEKKAKSLLRSMGFRSPIELQQSGFLGSITYKDRNVNIEGLPFDEVFREQAAEQVGKETSFFELRDEAEAEQPETEQLPDLQTAIRELTEQMARFSARLDGGEPQEEEANFFEIEGDSLADQLRRAQRQAAYWEKQAKRTEHPMLREQDVEKLTKDLLKGYESKADRAEMTGRIKELGEYILNGGPDLVWDEVQERAGQIAGDILDQSERVDDHMWRETAGLRQYLRTTRIKLDPDLKESKGFFPEGFNNFRRKYFHRLLLTNDGQNVDSVYTEAAGMWPGLLPDPEDVYSEGEALNNLVELLDSAPPRRYNPYEEGDADTDLDAARDLLTNDIIDGLLSENVRQEPPTVADKLAAEAARRKAAPAIREEARRQKTDEAIEQLEAESGEARHSVPTTAAELEAAAAKAKQATRQEQKILRSLRLTPKENALANDILAGTLTLNELRRSSYDEPVDKSKVERAYEAKKAAREAAAPVEEHNRQRRAALDKKAEELTRNSDGWKDFKNMLAYSRETARRIFYGLTKDEMEARALIAYYIDPIRKHEAEKNRMVAAYNDRIKSLKIETKVRSGNKVSEAYAVQYVGELEFIIDWLEDLPEGETRDGVTYGEAKMLLHEFWEENPNLDKEKIHRCVAEFRSIYNEIFAMVNEARVLNGYAPIDYRKGYFPHFSSDSGDNIIQSLAKGMGLGVEVTELPTSIAGTTHLFRPGIQWSGHMQRRIGHETDYNVLEGWDRYIPAVANIIYHTEDIQKLRALERVLRTKYSDATVRDAIESTRNSSELTAEEKYEELDKLFNRDVTQLNYFVQWVREYTNQLAGKKADADRWFEKELGRKFYRAVQKVENRVAANMLGGNLSSAITNFVPLFQAWGNVRTDSMMRAMWDTGVAAIRHDGFRDGSDFLVNRKGYDAMYQTMFGKAKNALFMPFNVIDDFVSETIVRARYYDELRTGATPEAAMMTANEFAGSVMADRAIGELPTIFNSKNPVVKVFTMFQVEVNNDISHLTKDIPREARKKGAAALFVSVLKYMLGVYMFNDLFEWLFGRRVSLDPLSMLNDIVGDATGYELPNMFESAVLIAKGEWGGWEEFENGKGGDFFSDLVTDMKEWADDVPFISGLLGGGRFPIQAMLPDDGAIKAGWEALQDILKGSEDQENTNEYDLSKMYKAVRNPLWYGALPAFGGQARKIAEGIYAYTQHGSYSQTKQGKVLQYPILDYRDLVKAMVFGKTTTRYGKEWVKSDFDSLTAPQTQAYINLVAGGSDPQLIYEMLHDLKGTDRTAVEKAYALATAKLSDDERIMLFGALDRDKEADNFADLMSAGLSFRQCADVLDEWTPLKAQADLTAEGDEGKPERTRLATQFAGWLDEEGYTDEQKEVILDNYKLGASPIRYDWLVRDGISNNGALELAMDWAELTPAAGSNKVTVNQKIDVVADAGYLTEKEKHIAVRSMLSDDVRQEDGGSKQTDYDKYVKGYDISVESFNQYLKVTTGVKGYDRDGDGKTDSGSKRDALFAAINTLPLQPGQKTALALYQGDYSESSIRKNAPWLR